MSEWIAPAFDALMFISVVGLWILWWRTSKKQVVIEQMLATAAHDLESATTSLGEAFSYLNKIKEREAMISQVSSMTKPEEEKPVHRAPAPVVKEIPERTDAAGNQLPRILRLKREGRDVDAIARELKLPKAQVQLLLRLHSAGSEKH